MDPLGKCPRTVPTKTAKKEEEEEEEDKLEVTTPKKAEM
jgi:hypothetical protein